MFQITTCRTGMPVVLALLLVACSGGGSTAQQNSWSVVGESAPGGAAQLLSGPDGNLYAAGGMRTKDGDNIRDGIARWDGQSWASVADEDIGDVKAMAVYDDGGGPAVHAVIRGDDFRLARLTPSGWERMGGRFHADVRVMAVADVGEGPWLFACPATEGPRLAWWDGEAWTPGSGQFFEGGAPNHAVRAIAPTDGAVYLGGDFDGVNFTEGEFNRVARWDGETWSPLGKGIRGDDLQPGYVAAVHALHVFNGDLYVGGVLTSAGDVETRGVARWDGEAWHEVGGGIEGTVRAFAEHDGKLYAAGDFTSVGDGVAANNIAVWDGDSWSALGEGMDDEVLALAAHGDGVYASPRSSFGDVMRWGP